MRRLAATLPKLWSPCLAATGSMKMKKSFIFDLKKDVRMKLRLIRPSKARSKTKTKKDFPLAVQYSNLLKSRNGCRGFTCSFLGFQRLPFIGIEEAKGCILCLAILCLGALP